MGDTCRTFPSQDRIREQSKALSPPQIYRCALTRHVKWAPLCISNICNDQKHFFLSSSCRTDVDAIYNFCDRGSAPLPVALRWPRDISSHYWVSQSLASSTEQLQVTALPGISSPDYSRRHFLIITNSAPSQKNKKKRAHGCFLIKFSSFWFMPFSTVLIGRSWRKQLSALLHVCHKCVGIEKQFAFRRRHSPGVISLLANVEELWFDTTFHTAPVKETGILLAKLPNSSLAVVWRFYRKPDIALFCLPPLVVLPWTYKSRR